MLCPDCIPITHGFSLLNSLATKKDLSTSTLGGFVRLNPTPHSTIIHLLDPCHLSQPYFLPTPYYLLQIFNYHLYIGYYQVWAIKPFFKLPISSNSNANSLNSPQNLPFLQCSLSVLTLIFFKTLQSETVELYVLFLFFHLLVQSFPINY